MLPYLVITSNFIGIFGLAAQNTATRYKGYGRHHHLPKLVDDNLRRHRQRPLSASAILHLISAVRISYFLTLTITFNGFSNNTFVFDGRPQ